MRDVATALGYTLTVAVAASLCYAGYTHLLGLRSDVIAMAAAGLCGAAAATLAWPGTSGDDVLNRPRADLVIGSRTALLFYVLFTTATVIERFPEYFGAVDGINQTLTTLLLSLPGLVVVSLGAMIYATMGGAFFLSVIIARFWVRQARRAHAAQGARVLPPHPPAA